MSVIQLKQESERTGLPMVSIAANKGLKEINLSQIWGDINPIEDNEDKYFSGSLVSNDTFLANFSRDISAAIQFPVNTIMLHSMGVLASAMTRSFYVKYTNNSTKPLTLYTVTAQPPSSGKSGVNDVLCHAIRESYKKLNKKTDQKRAEIEGHIAAAKRELKDLEKNKENVHSNRIKGINKDISEKTTELKKYQKLSHSVTDATVEGCESEALRQNGMFNVVSPESDVINVLLGNTYGDGKQNLGVVLSAWDGEFVNISRSGREGFEGYIKGCIAVIAQDEAIESILNSTGDRGIEGRFLMLMEEDLLGTRDHTQKKDLDYRMLEEYQKLIDNIVLSEKVVLDFTPNSRLMISQFRNSIEPHMRKGFRYSHYKIRGFVGKADKHVMKMASILHVTHQWGSSGNKDTIVSDDMVALAIGMYKELCTGFIKATGLLGLTGREAQLLKLVEFLQKRAEKKKLKMDLKAIRDGIKNLKVFSNSGKLTQKLREDLLPELQNRNYITITQDHVFINPKL